MFALVALVQQLAADDEPSPTPKLVTTQARPSVLNSGPVASSLLLTVDTSILQRRLQSGLSGTVIRKTPFLSHRQFSSGLA